MPDFSKIDVLDYEIMSKRYLPDYIKHIFILESPSYPEEDVLLFFYNINTPSQKDTLFKLFIRAIYGIKYRKGDEKHELLSMFKQDGHFLIDAVGYPINKDINGIEVKNESIKIEEILKNREILLQKLQNLKDKGILNNTSRIILIKKSVFNALYDFLNKNGFKVINRGKINYPNKYDYNFIGIIHRLLYGTEFIRNFD
jgi:hypothetical protein